MQFDTHVTDGHCEIAVRQTGPAGWRGMCWKRWRRQAGRERAAVDDLLSAGMHWGTLRFLRRIPDSGELLGKLPLTAVLTSTDEVLGKRDTLLVKVRCAERLRRWPGKRPYHS